MSILNFIINLKLKLGMKFLSKVNEKLCFFSVGVKVLRDCGVQTVEVDPFSNPQGTE